MPGPSSVGALSPTSPSKKAADLKGPACLTCFTAHRRCDGEIPCKTCTERGLICRARRPGEIARVKASKQRTSRKHGSTSSSRKAPHGNHATSSPMPSDSAPSLDDDFIRSSSSSSPPSSLDGMINEAELTNSTSSMSFAHYEAYNASDLDWHTQLLDTPMPSSEDWSEPDFATVMQSSGRETERERFDGYMQCSPPVKALRDTTSAADEALCGPYNPGNAQAANLLMEPAIFEHHIVEDPHGPHAMPAFPSTSDQYFTQYCHLPADSRH